MGRTVFDTDRRDWNKNKWQTEENKKNKRTLDVETTLVCVYDRNVVQTALDNIITVYMPDTVWMCVWNERID